MRHHRRVAQPVAPQIQQHARRAGTVGVQRGGEGQHAQRGGLDAVDEEDAGWGCWTGCWAGRAGDGVVCCVSGGGGEPLGGWEKGAEGLRKEGFWGTWDGGAGMEGRSWAG